MSDSYIDLFRPPFWIAVVGALLLLTPITRAGLRKSVWAVVNAAFIWHLLGLQAVAVFAAVVITWACLGLLARGRAWWPSLALGIGASFALFILHKLPGVSESAGLSRVNPILTAVGFSYVCLRLFDLLRAVAERRHPAPDVAAVVNYLLPFHMLAAGPIQSYDEFVAQPAVPPAPKTRDCLVAIERISFGLFKKYVLANVLDAVFLTGFETEGIHFFVEVQIFFLWLYLDFSAYSDIAVGVGKLLGVATPENFNRPYFAPNMISFWERWHISLGQFIRRNVFIPLQLTMQRQRPNANPVVVASLSFIISFLLCGLWHEISWRFFLWGGTHALGLVGCNLYKHYVRRKLGREGFKQYLKVRWIRAAAVIVTYEYVAFSLVLVGGR